MAGVPTPPTSRRAPTYLDPQSAMTCPTLSVDPERPGVLLTVTGNCFGGPPADPRYQLLDTDDVAHTLKVSVRTVDTLVAEGRLRPIRIRPRTRRFRPEDVDDFIDGCYR